MNAATLAEGRARTKDAKENKRMGGDRWLPSCRKWVGLVRSNLKSDNVRFGINPVKVISF